MVNKDEYIYNHKTWTPYKSYRCRPVTAYYIEEANYLSWMDVLIVIITEYIINNYGLYIYIYINLSTNNNCYLMNKDEYIYDHQTD